MLIKRHKDFQNVCNRVRQVLSGLSGELRWPMNENQHVFKVH